MDERDFVFISVSNGMCIPMCQFNVSSVLADKVLIASLLLPCKFDSCEWNDTGSNFGIQTSRYTTTNMYCIATCETGQF